MTTDERDSGRPDPQRDLDAELRRLFADDRLDVPVSRHASATVVAGARRRRRNRMAMATAGGVAAMAAIVFAAATLSGLVHPTDRVSAADPSSGIVLSTTITTTTPTAAPPSAQADSAAVLGPDGYGDLLLGMSWQDALASGELRQSAPLSSAGCLRYSVVVDTPVRKLPVTPTPNASGSAPATALPPLPVVAELVVSVRNGVVQVIAGPLLRTPEGVGVGTSRDVLADVYPKLVAPTRGGAAVTAVVANPKAVYMFDLSGTGVVTSFSLRLAKSDCLG
ncbi:MAG TPA: hypothetical protein VGD84_19595 [Pseudonocardiaceae bacterium]